MANPQIHQQLTQHGAPPELAARFTAAGGVVQGLNLQQWIQLVGKYGPVLWAILQDILASQNNQPVNLAPYQGQEAQQTPQTQAALAEAPAPKKTPGKQP